MLRRPNRSRPGGGSLRWLSGPAAVSAGPDARPKGRLRRGREAAPRRVYQQVKLTEMERDLLRARAAELGMSVPRLMVESALSGLETPTERRRLAAELFETRRLLATVANNVNQLARSANISGQVSEGRRLEQTLAEVDELVAELRKLTGVRR
jgi:Bacterial mobilisation protein (MobC)